MMWRRSWLSREVLLFSMFAGAGQFYAAALWFNSPTKTVLGAGATVIGLCAIFASARLYTVPARPAWNSRHTFAEFYLSALFSGPLFAALFLPEARQRLHLFALAAAFCILSQQIAKFVWLNCSEVFELHTSGMLLARTLQSPLLMRAAGLLLLGLLLSFAGVGPVIAAIAFVTSLALEILGRWLFFVSVVPKNMASSYLDAREAA